MMMGCVKLQTNFYYVLAVTVVTHALMITDLSSKLSLRDFSPFTYLLLLISKLSHKSILRPVNWHSYLTQHYSLKQVQFKTKMCIVTYISL